MRTDGLLTGLALVQVALGARVIWRMGSTARGERISAQSASEACGGSPLDACAPCERVTVLVPVLNERERLAPCLEGALAQGPEVTEIVVVDGGSHDGTQQLICEYAGRDPRLRLVSADPIPDGWNGKAWGLHAGQQAARTDTRWILTLDADVRPAPGLARALLAQAKHSGLAALSVATQQDVAGAGLGMVHPALLATLVYRFGIPGNIARGIREVQANGQCFLVRRDALADCGGFAEVRDSLCEDVTLARALVASGHPVGFYEAGELVTASMYANWRDAWRNWTRSLPMRDRFSGAGVLLGWLEVALVQALPLPLVATLTALRVRADVPLAVNAMLAATRVGVLCGMRRAYCRVPWSYWLSPLCDLPAAIQLGVSALRRRHRWRGRLIVRGGFS